MILQLPLSRREGHWYLTRTLADTDALLRKADAARAAASPSPAEAPAGVGKQQRRRLSHNGADVETEPAAVSRRRIPVDARRYGAGVPSTGTGPNPVPPPVHARPAGRRPLWARLLGRLVEPWLSLKIEPEDPGQYNDGRPVVYVLEDYGLSNALIWTRPAARPGCPRRWCRWPVTRPGASAPTGAVAAQLQQLADSRAARRQDPLRFAGQGPAGAPRARRLDVHRCRCLSSSAARRTSRAAGSRCCSRKTGRWSVASAACWACC